MDALLAEVRGLSKQVDLLREVLGARPEPAAKEITIRVVHTPPVRIQRRRRRQEGLAVNIE